MEKSKLKTNKTTNKNIGDNLKINNNRSQLDRNVEKEIDQKILQVKIETLNINGEGVSHYQGKKVCVGGVLPGEEVECQVEVEKPTFLGCKLLKVLSPNSNRITPKCKYSGNCGGCNFDFIDYNTSLLIKKETLQNYFNDLFDGQVDVVKSKSIFNYRNKVSLYTKNGELGYKKQTSNVLVQIEQCLLTNLQINNMILRLKNFVNKLNSKNLTHVVVRSIENSVILTFVFKKMDKESTTKVKEFCYSLNDVKGVDFGVYINVNNANHEILGDEWHHIFGLKTQKSILDKTKFEVHPYSFLQVNNDIRDKIYNFVLKNIQNQTVIEGYSGAGIMSCMLAKKAKHVYSVEINKQSYLNAENAKITNKISNLTNINDSCQNVLPELVRQNPDSIFLIDPPRSGCNIKTLQALKESKIKKIIYISCNPYTLKQNIGFLKEEYKIDSLTMFDMFPNTFHMETVVILNKI